MKKELLFGLFTVVLAITSCTKNDVLNNEPNDTNDSLGEKAYLSVNITDATAITRASSNDDDFEYGSEDEQKVTSAEFYFYDENGIYVTKANVWDGGTANTNTPAENIEYFGKSVIVLKGLTATNFPKYVVTVLNTPTGFVPGKTLKEMESTLSYAAARTDGGYRNGDNFIMSTTSFVPKNTASDFQYYFATEVSESDFKKEPTAAAEELSPVQIYVERLAAKVSLKVDADQSNENALSSPVQGEDGATYYKLKITVAGMDNSAEDNYIAAEDIYIKFLGWGLNATAKESNIVKNIDLNWKNENLGFVWNVSDYYRSFWGKSYNYEKDGYPQTSNEAEDCPYLNYVSANQLTKTINASDYCAENTNTSAIISDNFPSAVTSILLKAQICSDTKGTALDLVRYNGLLYTVEAYKNYVLNNLKNTNRLDVWYKSGDDTYHQIDGTYVELKNSGDGKILVQLTQNAKQATLYMKGSDTTPSTVMNDTDKDNFNNTLSEFNEKIEAIGYTDGLMYYNIPIEHLNNNENTTTDQGTVIPEAKYGVVRNHHYVVTVTSLSKLGKGIFQPGEVIVPTDDEDKDTYYVGARINILSWKIVNQTVEL